MVFNPHVVAVIVTFNSDLNRLAQSLQLLMPQCNVLVVDNSTDFISQNKIKDLCFKNGIFILTLGENFGIGHAQNLGIDWARKNSATDILLMDDDSIPSKTLVGDLLDSRKLSLVQPVVVSARTISDSGVDLSNVITIVDDCALIPCSELTSSGALISIEICNLVGEFDSQLFIDCVDFEWGWRAKSLGVPLFLCKLVTIQHRLGVCTRFGLRLPTPIRHYYQYRNILRMIIFSEAPVYWRLLQLVKLPIKLVLIILIANQRFERLYYAVMGVKDFIAGRNGQYNH
jgi:rhamnosyltransferase